MHTRPGALPSKHVRVLVVGGGPAGSFAASVLAREGLQVTLLEAAKFPRYHIGESLIPSVRPFLRFIGAEDKVVKYGFARKPGAAIKFNQYKEEGYTDFVALGHSNNAWNVVRSDFDELLLNHSRECGAEIFEETRVTSFNFSHEDPSQPVSACWDCTVPTFDDSMKATSKSQVKGSTSFEYLVDASGRNGIMSTKYLKNRRFNSALKNIAVWGYWEHCGCYGIGTAREGAPFFEALTDESGWAWFIPLPNGTTSVGIVMNHDIYNNRSEEPLPPSLFPTTSTPNPTNSTMIKRYHSNLSLAPTLSKLMTKKAIMREGSVKMASDFSYSIPSYAGRNYRIIGDAGAFIDPFFSSGIHLAFTSALSAAASICASIRGDCSEDRAGAWHTRRFSMSYSRFQLVVLSAYKQFRNQSASVLSDIDEDNFDRAFAFFRPIIQGGSEIGVRLSDNEVQRSLEFCANLFAPTTPEQHQDLLNNGILSEEHLDINSPMLGLKEIKSVLKGHKVHDRENEGSDGEMVLRKVNARKVLHMEYSISNLEAEAIDGLAVRLQQGNLGLSRM